MSVIPPAYLSHMAEDEHAGSWNNLSLNPISQANQSINSSGNHQSAQPTNQSIASQSFTMSVSATPRQSNLVTFLPGPHHNESDVFRGLTTHQSINQSISLNGHTPDHIVHSIDSEAQGLLDHPQDPSIHSDSSSSLYSSPDSPGLPSYKPPPLAAAHAKLSQWFATAICGNDITSSCFYVTGLCVQSAGVYAPVCMALVAATLYLFRAIYGEAVTALPLNGGAYNVLLNTTSKSTAAIAACLTILSYMATAVVSAASAIAYLNDLWPDLPPVYGVLILLGFFAFLCLWGMSESADVALVIFTIHMATLFTLVVVTITWLISNGAVELWNNFKSPYNPPFQQALFYGFASAMLGVSGFESSANFVEEQADGVFVKTLRNMWACVAFFNPLIATLSLMVFSIDVLSLDVNINISLALLAKQCGGEPLRIWVCVDAFMVLAGSVLTAFVGVSGLCRRLALDRCLPQFLLAENRLRGTAHWIILGFLGICSSIYLLLGRSDAGIAALSSVYAISFLSVMSLFAVGNMLLKYKRGFLPRSVRATWGTVLLALGMVLVALAGQLAQNASVLAIWFAYFSGVGALLACMFFRLPVLRLIYALMYSLSMKCGFGENARLLKSINQSMTGISKQAVAFFVKGGQLSVLNKAILYVRQNEDCGHIRVVHVYEQESLIPKKLQRNVQVLQEAYPKVKIDLILVQGSFGPEIIDYISQECSIPKNLCFITSPKEDFMHKLESLGGVRLITH